MTYQQSLLCYTLICHLTPHLLNVRIRRGGGGKGIDPALEASSDSLLCQQCQAPSDMFLSKLELWYVPTMNSIGVSQSDNKTQKALLFLTLMVTRNLDIVDPIE